MVAILRVNLDSTSQERDQALFKAVTKVTGEAGPHLVQELRLEEEPKAEQILKALRQSSELKGEQQVVVELPTRPLSKTVGDLLQEGYPVVIPEFDDYGNFRYYTAGQNLRMTGSVCLDE